MAKKKKKKDVKEMDLSGATVTSYDPTTNAHTTVKVPKEIIKNKQANAWRFDYVTDKTMGATFNIGEFCAPIVTMPNGWVDESKMVNEYSGSASVEYKQKMKELLIYKGIIDED